ncbi:MAG: GntR family transcriptional regulator [Desulfobulbaceae bacterium]|jgi:DNA-binding GntR family transcriptional regulator|nr:GntR family transcriptional regulator [Desulfobulbaceae bacterium]
MKAINSKTGRKNPTSQTSKEEQAYLQIKKSIIARKFAPGQKIIFRDLEEILGMSKTPITSALARLEQEGFLSSEHNRGYYVKELSKDEIKQLYRLRIGLEEIAVEFAVENYNDDDFATLHSILDAYLNHDCSFYDAKRLQLDLDFHLQIARMGGNKYLIQFLTQIYERARIGLNPVFMTPLIPRFRDEHSQIVEAIKRRDAQQAKMLIRAHEHISIELLDSN